MWGKVEQTNVLLSTVNHMIWLYGGKGKFEQGNNILLFMVKHNLTINISALSYSTL